MEHYDVIVVGCGVAGLNATATLGQFGKKVLALDASDRIGGRVHTIEFGNGLVELGAEWIHGEKGNDVFALAQTNNMPLLKQNIDFGVYLSGGEKPNQDLYIELLDFCHMCIETAPDSTEPLGEYVTKKFYEYVKTKPEIKDDENFCKEFLAFAELVVCNNDGTNTWNDMSIEGSNVYHYLEGHQHWSWHKLGYKTLFNLIMPKNLPNVDIKLKKEVAQIEWGGDKSNVVITCLDKSKYQAETVLVTVSLGVLKERHLNLFSPSLPEIKIKALDCLDIGVVDKICLLYSTEWWPKDKTFYSFIWKSDDKQKISKKDGWITKILGFSCPQGSSNVITLWTSGENAKEVELIPRSELMIKCRELLQLFMGPSINVPECIDIQRSCWFSNAFFRGSYCFRSFKWDKNKDACQQLIEPLTNNEGQMQVLFAGEATSEHFFSTVHGALQSGLREANRILSKDNYHSKI